MADITRVPLLSQLTDQAVCGANQAHCAAGQDYTITVS